MRPRPLFLTGLAAFVSLYFLYGLKRFALGVDFTDEGAYVAWPLRQFFGEAPFSSETMTLLRPLEVYFTLPFKLNPDITLYEFRLLGWSVHLGAFAALACYLFRLCAAPLTSVLIASVPFFVCHLFGLAPPSYNTLSSDFLLIALSLRGLATDAPHATNRALGIAAGLALFVATFAHPGLGLVAAGLLIYEVVAQQLPLNLLRRSLTSSNLGMLAFLACWTAFAIYFVASGAAATWWARLPLTKSFAGNSLHSQPAQFFLRLAGYPLVHSRLAAAASIALMFAGGAKIVLARTGHAAAAARANLALLVLVSANLIATFSYEPDDLPIALVQSTFVLFAVRLCERAPATQTTTLMLASLGAAAIYATLTYYFNSHRSWLAGSLGLPFAFAVGFASQIGAPGSRRAIETLLPLVLVLAVACAAREHFRSIYRDGVPSELTAEFRAPRLRGLRSTPERVQAVDALCAWFAPRLAPGAPLLAFDDCPMLYFILHAPPAYGLTWAVRYTQSSAALRQLDAELRARPLPRFAIRTLVDISHVTWATAPRTRYENYPLNETLLANYALAQTIFPFEIWELKSARSLEKASPKNPPP